MVFSSIEFLALFLPLFLLAYMATPSSARNATLCLGSWAFYAWWKPVFLLLIVGITFVAWYLGREIGRADRRGDERRERQILAGGIVVILFSLCWFKYANLLVHTASDAMQTMALGPIPWTNVILPIALSFTVLQSVSYLIDVRRRTVVAEPSFISFAAYLDMFPHLIAGPIIRYSWVDKALVERQITFADLSIGARRFMLGFAVKVLIADTLAPVVEAAFDLPNPSFADAWLGNICFAFQIFFDFAGYSAMAIGLGRMLGFKYPENFRDPYLAVTIQDFWRRWHISLSSWLRDYLYISLGGNRHGDVRTYSNLFVTMAIGGLWHGASWSFLLWGVIHGSALAIARFWDQRGLWWPGALSYPATILTVLFAWTPFRATSWEGTLAMLSGQVGLHGFAMSDQMILVMRPLLWLWMGIAAVVVFWPAAKARFSPRFENTGEWWEALWPIAVFLYAIAVMMGHQTVPFLYFQF
ncbi:MAG TPA: MBOAT family O-acyltransferase [Stellaceae bacterium]|nr:MBOAT family O-acyltransferase [Stellaceae bacterium]